MRRASVTGLVIGLLAGLAGAAFAVELEYLLEDFETAERVGLWRTGSGGGEASVEPSTEHVTRGKHSCKAVFSGERYPYALLEFAPEQQEKLDWEAYEHYEFDVYNSSDEQVTLNWLVTDANGANVDRWLDLKPNSSTHAKLSIRSMRDHIALSKVKTIYFGFSKPKEPRTVFLDNIRLTSTIEPVPPLVKFPDVAIVSRDISVAPARPKPGDPLTVTVTVRNRGAKPAEGLDVAVWSDRTRLWDLATTVTVPGKGEEKFTFNLPAFRSGLRTVMVRLDPANKIREAREDNNSAGVFVTDLEHPYVLLSPSKLPLLRERINREPCKGWWQQVKQSADEHLETDFTKDVYEKFTSKGQGDGYHRGPWARDLAFAYLITGEEKYAAKAREALVNIDVRDARLYGLGVPTVMIFHSEAYDWIASSGLLSPEDKQNIQDRIAQIVQPHYRRALRDSVARGRSNGTVRCAGGLAIAGLALAGYDSPTHGNAYEWLDYVCEDLFENSRHDYAGDNLVESMVTPGGEYVESPDYCFYAFKIVVPFFTAYKELCGVDYWNWRDRAGNPRIRNMYDTEIKTTFPNRMIPNIGGSNPGRFKTVHYGTSAFVGGGVYRWYFDEIGRDIEQPIESIILYDDTVAPASPEGLWSPTQFMPNTSSQVFRSDWGRDATWMLLRTPHFENNTSHTHCDHTAFIIYAKRAYLAIDSGDGRGYGWGNDVRNIHTRLWIDSAQGHNLIMIDDDPWLPKAAHRRAVAWSPTYLKDHFTTAFLDYCRIDSERGRGVSQSRHVLFPHHNYFVVYDEMRSAKEHDYDFRLHLGPDMQMERGHKHRPGKLVRSAPNHLRWQTLNEQKKGVELGAYFAAPGVTVTDHLGGTNWRGHDDLFDHVYLKAHARAANTKFLTLLYPRLLDEPDPKIETINADEITGVRLTLGKATDTFLLGGGAEKTAGSTGEVVAFSENDGRLAWFMIRNGTRFVYDGKVVFESTAPATVALRFGRDDIDGYVWGVGDYEVSVHGVGRVPTQPMFGAQMIAGTHRYVTGFKLSDTGAELTPHTWTLDKEKGILRMRLAGRGRLRIPLAIPHSIP